MTYTGEPQVGFVVLPLQVFGIYYAVDMVLQTRHPDWQMHEYVRIDHEEGSTWLAKDSDLALAQSIVADLPELQSWAPEVPVPRFSRPLEVVDQSEGRHIDVQMAYRNSVGDPVEVSFRSTMPRKPPSRRNGSTMGHSNQVVAAVLDLERFGHGGAAQVTIGGERWPIRRLAGVYRSQFLLQQAQGGVVVSSFVQRSSEGGFEVERPSPGVEWPTRSVESWTVDEEVASHDNGFTRMVYRFVEGGLVRAEVHQVLRADPVFVLHLSPALPDLSRPFEGVAESAFRMDVNGQQGHGAGRIRARWEQGQVVLDMEPDQPWWLADRPMRGQLHMEDGAVRVEMSRVPQ
ncbi:MAG: hypothetical protein QGG40_02850 [Myxococcota bacterium]|nr:hypothetical protein [Myxococcota bacterium]